MSKNKKCLVTEAMDKCQCEDCKSNRDNIDFIIKQHIMLEDLKDKIMRNKNGYK